MDTLYLVRHAKAGERRTWTGPDEERPLSKKGWKQSKRVATHLERKAVGKLYSSHYVRCMQTLEPLAELLDTKVRELDELAEYEPPEPLVSFLAEAKDRSVFCSHGDVIPATIDLLRCRGMKLESKPDWRKTSIWVLRRNKHGAFVRAHVVPPPAV